jgi:carbonic anhydrase/acetyltransferase-like protein (isoleucine patch superfamily)
MIHKNPETEFAEKEYLPDIDASAFIHPLAAVIGNVIIGKKVMVSPFASMRGDEGQPLFVGDESNIQDGVVIHALETDLETGKNLMDSEQGQYAVYVGKRVSLSHQSQVHGPACVEDDTLIGMQSLILKTRIGKSCVVEPKCLLMGVEIKAGRYVPAGSVIKSQEEADNLPVITDKYVFKSLNSDVVKVNMALAAGYKKMKL